MSIGHSLICYQLFPWGELAVPYIGTVCSPQGNKKETILEQMKKYFGKTKAR